jgi:hypothetical protein
LNLTPKYFILGLAKLFFMVYRENIGQLKHLPFYDFRNYRHIQTQSPPPPIQLEFGAPDAVFTYADVKTQ